MRKAGGSPSRTERATEITLAEALALAVARHREGRYLEAAAIYQKILDVVPDNIDALHFLGLAKHQAGHAKAALGMLDRALALAPDQPDVLRARGNVYRTLRRLDAAEADYRRALELQPDDADILGSLGTVLRARGDLEGAIAMYRAVIAKRPDHVTAWQNLASALDTLERRAEAVAAYREAARLSPDSAALLRDLGVALFSDGCMDEAVEMYRRCLAVAPGDPRALHLLAAATGKDTPARAPDDYVRAEFDAFAPRFDAKLAALEYRGPAIVAEAVASIVPQLPPHPVVLDAGCGTGLCASLLRPCAGVLVGVDLSPAMIERARTRGGYDELVVGELTAFLRERAFAYDLVVSADTLVYFGDLRDVVAAAAQALRPRGAFVFTLERSPPNAAATGFHLHPHGRYSHTGDYVTSVLRVSGFVDTTITEISSRKEIDVPVPGWLVCARRPGEIESQRTSFPPEQRNRS